MFRLAMVPYGALWCHGAMGRPAGLYSEGILKPDEFGRVNSQHLKEAMVEVGSTVPNASLQGQKSQVKSADVCTAKAYLKAYLKAIQRSLNTIMKEE